MSSVWLVVVRLMRDYYGMFMLWVRFLCLAHTFELELHTRTALVGSPYTVFVSRHAKSCIPFYVPYGLHIHNLLYYICVCIAIVLTTNRSPCVLCALSRESVRKVLRVTWFKHRVNSSELLYFRMKVSDVICICVSLLRSTWSVCVCTCLWVCLLLSWYIVV